MGTLMVRPRYAHGPFNVLSQSAEGTLTVRSRYTQGSVPGMLEVSSRYDHGQLKVGSRTVQFMLMVRALETAFTLKTARCSPEVCATLYTLRKLNE
jgi:hypothetical protein